MRELSSVLSVAGDQECDRIEGEIVTQDVVF